MMSMTGIMITTGLTALDSVTCSDPMHTLPSLDWQPAQRFEIFC